MTKFFVRVYKIIMSFVVVSLRDYFPVYYHPDFSAPANFLLKAKFDKKFDPDREGLFFGRIEKTYAKKKLQQQYNKLLEDYYLANTNSKPNAPVLINGEHHFGNDIKMSQSQYTYVTKLDSGKNSDGLFVNALLDSQYSDLRGLTVTGKPKANKSVKPIDPNIYSFIQDQYTKRIEKSNDSAAEKKQRINRLNYLIYRKIQNSERYKKEKLDTPKATD